MKQNDKNKDSFIKYGISSELAEKLTNNHYTVTKVKTASKKDFKGILTRDEIETLILKVKRQPIMDDVYDRLVKECEMHCCFCWNLLEEKPVIIHHIDEYNQTQDNSFNNLIVLCLNHHGEVHTKREISQQNYPKSRLLHKKEIWIEEIKEYRKGNRSAPGAETKPLVQTVINSPASINTQNQVGSNYLIKNGPHPRLVYFPENTKPEYLKDKNIYSTLYVFGSEEGIGLTNPEIEIHFDKEFEDIDGRISSRSIAYGGNMIKEKDPSNKWYKFKTHFLHPDNYIVLEVKSKTILTIEIFYTKPF